MWKYQAVPVVQPRPQLMRSVTVTVEMELSTVPSPVPALRRVSRSALRTKLAETLLAASMVTVHVPEPLQAPDQPLKVAPVLGVAVRVTVVPLLK